MQPITIADDFDSAPTIGQVGKVQLTFPCIYKVEMFVKIDWPQSITHLDQEYWRTGKVGTEILPSTPRLNTLVGQQECGCGVMALWYQIKGNPNG